MAVYNVGGRGGRRGAEHQLSPPRDLTDAFPLYCTSLLDDFNRANEATLSGSGHWARLTASSEGVLEVFSNQLTRNATSVGSAYYTQIPDATLVESYITVAAKGNSAASFGLLACLTGVGTNTYSGYKFSITIGGSLNASYNLSRIDAGVSTTIASKATSVPGPADPLRSFVNGDKMGIRVYPDGVIECWVFQATDGFWRLVFATKDTTYTRGYIGVHISPSGSARSTILDDFVGPCPTGHIQKSLAYSRRGVTKSDLYPPAVVNQPVSFVATPIATTFAYQSRGKPLSRYIAPAAVLTTAFPSCDAVLDNFDRPDENPLSGGGNWAKLNSNATTDLAVSSNTIVQSPASAVLIAASYWTQSSALEFTEVKATIAVAPGNGAFTYLFARLQDVGGADTYDGYRFTVRRVSGNTTFTISLITNVAPTTLSSVTQVGIPQVGDKLGARASGSTLELWYYQVSTGAWQLITVATDATYATGYMGIGIGGSGALDDFGTTCLGLEGIKTQFARITPPATISRLAPATVVNPAVSAQTFTGPKVKLVLPIKPQTRSVLHIPAVIGDGIVFAPIQTSIAPSTRGRPLSYLLPPNVVGAGIVFRALQVELTYSRRGQPKSHLSQPAVVGAGIVFSPIAVALAPSKFGKPRSVLFPPIIPPVARPLEEKLIVQLARAQLERRLAFPRLLPPAVVGAGIVFRPINRWLAYSRRGHPRTDLFPPAVVGAGIVFRSLQIQLTYSRRGVPKPRLSLPAVIGAGIVFAPVSTWLTYSLRGKPRSLLAPPVLPPLARPLEAELTVQLVRAELTRRLAFPRLAPPAVIGAGIVYRSLQVELTYSRRGAPKSALRAPAVVDAGIIFAPITIWLAPSTRGKPRSLLSAPIIPPLARPVEAELTVQLARVTQERRLAFPRLLPPAVVGAGIVYRPLQIELTYSRRGTPKSRLIPPTVVAAADIFAPIAVSLAASTRGHARSFLRPPARVPVAAPIETKLAVQIARTLSKRDLSQTVLFSPVLVFAPVVFPPVKVTLTPSHQIGRQRRYRSLLEPPTVIQPATLLFFGPQTHLAYSRRGTPKPRLLPPAVVGAGVVYRALQIELTYSRRGVPRSRLAPAIIPPLARPVETEVAVQLARTQLERRLACPRLFLPAVIGAGIVFPGIQIRLAYSLRGKAKSSLKAPAVVGAGIVFAPVFIWLAPSFRGKPRSLLRPAVIPPVARPIETEVVVQLARAQLERRLAFPRLLPPAVVGAGIYFRGIQIHLAYALRGKPKSLLKPPAVVGAGVVFSPVVVSLAASFRGKPRSFLLPAIIPPLARPVETKLTVQLARAELARRLSFPRLLPPTVVGAGIVFRAVQVELSPSHQIGRQRRYRSQLEPPTVVQPLTLVFFGPHTALTYSRRGKPKPRLSVPAVVGAGIVFRGIQAHLTYALRGRAKSKLFAPVFEPALARPLETKLTIQLARIERRLANSKLIPPAVVGAGIYFRGIQAHLAPSPKQARVTHPVLGKLIVQEQLEALGATSITLVRGRPGHTRPVLAPPAVVGAGIVYRALQIELTYSVRGKPKAHLFPPAVVGAGRVFAPITVWLAPASQGKPKSHLAPAIIPPVARPTKTDLTVQLTRARVERRLAFPRLGLPAVVGAGIVFAPLAVTLAPSYQIGHQRRYESKLSQPTVVQPATVVFYGPKVTLAAGRNQTELVRRQAKPRYVFPIIVQVAVPLGGVLIQLARTPRKRSISTFIKPAVSAAGVLYPIKVTFARRTATELVRRAAKPLYVVPIVVLVRAEEGGLLIQLVRSPRTRTLARLAPPTVVATAFAAYPIRVTLARIKPPLSTGNLFVPAVVGAGIVYRALQVELAPSHQIGWQRQYLSRLTPPTVVQPITLVFFGPQTTLTYSGRGKPTSNLLPPAVVGAGIYFRSVLVHLAYARRGRAKSKLSAAIIPPIARPIKVALVRIRPLPTRSRLRVPVVVGLAPFRPIDTTLVRIRPVKTRSLLRAPVIPPLAIPIQITLVRGRAGIPRSLLRQPTVTRAVLVEPIRATLAPGRAGRALHVLQAPIVVRAAVTGEPIRVTLARIRPVRTVGQLRPAVVIEQPPFRPIQITLVLSRPPILRAQLNQPVVVRAQFVAQPIQVTLAAIRPVPVTAFVQPAAVVGAGVVFAPIQVMLTRIRPARTQSMLRAVKVLFSISQGDVCGFITTNTDVCDTIATSTGISGGISTRSVISGTTAPGSTITGGTSSRSRVTGDDGKAT